MLFSEVIGQESIKQKLRLTIAEKRISHAQLFYGTEGVGCLPLALAYAQYINCLNRTETDSCGKCSSCKKYNKLIHPDLHFVFPVVKTDTEKKPVSDKFISKWRELVLENPYFTLHDWYSKIQVEKKQGGIFEAESEKIIKKLSLKPFESEYKTMIIWRPEKMNRFTANKLLKLIEEPPPKTLIFLVANQLENILPTILSRTFQIKVPPVNDTYLIEALTKRGNSNINEVKDIVRISEGSITQAIQNIDKSEEDSFNFNNLQTLMRLAFKLKVEAALKWVEEMSFLPREKQKSFLLNGLRILRENFAFKYNLPEIQYMSKTEKDWAAKFSIFINEKNIEQFNKEFNLAHYHIERNANSKIVFFDLVLKVSILLKK
ncbi:MAG: DNA polymerase III subunit delta [Chlorobi bacterium]|nr:DNA polymerase III subunit delta [Chlorobiota bacterium]